MSLYSDAVTAYQASQGDLEAEARTELTAVLGSGDSVTALTVADIDVDTAFTRYVFSDGYLDIAVVLAQTGNSVRLVTGAAGDWTDRGVVTSLSQLGGILPSVLPPPVTPPPTAPAWTPGTTYAVGDKVTYNGVVYTCLIGHTAQPSWTPPTVQTMWQAAA